MVKNFEDYHIRICTAEDRPSLINFIHTYWKPNHVLAASMELLDWQHFDEIKQRYNFVLAQHLKTQEIHGVLGFISPQHFDPGIKEGDIWLTTWKVRQEVARVGLGLALYRFFGKGSSAAQHSHGWTQPDEHTFLQIFGVSDGQVKAIFYP